MCIPRDRVPAFCAVLCPPTVRAPPPSDHLYLTGKGRMESQLRDVNANPAHGWTLPGSRRLQAQGLSRLPNAMAAAFWTRRAEHEEQSGRPEVRRWCVQHWEPGRLWSPCCMGRRRFGSAQLRACVTEQCNPTPAVDALLTPVPPPGNDPFPSGRAGSSAGGAAARCAARAGHQGGCRGGAGPHESVCVARSCWCHALHLCACIRAGASVVAGAQWACTPCVDVDGSEHCAVRGCTCPGSDSRAPSPPLP